MTQPSVIRLSETLPTATHHGFGQRHYEWPWSWAWAWCLRTICHWLPCLTTAFGYATIHCPHSDHTLFDYSLWQTATHSPPHLHSHQKSMDNRAHEWSPRSHQNQSQCLARHILSPCTSSRTEWNYRVTEWRISWRATGNIPLYLRDWSLISSCWWVIPAVNWYHHKVSATLCLTWRCLISCQILQAYSTLFYVLRILRHTSAFSNRPDSDSTSNSCKPLLQVFWQVYRCHRWNTHLCVLIHSWSHVYAQ